MSNYDNWKTDPDFDGSQGSAIEAAERQHDEELRTAERHKLKSSAFDFFAQFMRRIDNASDNDLRECARKVGKLADLLLTYEKDEIAF